ncbi:bifunctional metallophosphatase/5'-nucleotidase [Deinococcus radiodurans]|jgi:5''-nucleotidase/2'',3''-cyclic phosphodiesterase and related esterases|uniref:bifunctional metallophosphatase/5'-nucleotidase n=1 Tax=Deinococcus radiodurans TaxID=1299 RepID=UPI00047F0207|nr:bifunctional metallophosphatase/5'-nucleotidase [Deinococcus radiodurans]ANC72888.1 multifunctional 2',3'-cyclic-nucleotide 2'-phosphodiesterase/5'-nucleotidase/3'-nucleotidase [Deinococcus radiodurans R1 = ATCC 13939 = DSM 20539]QEM73161.1 multifunctional 2',3'-cyclic-nucleotide 2'-phosphodiesterase/5'-nucleotidase/3'-nucleotidase [Deinococcus radiodurans]QIP30475.1 multifunctional 2',3'-cyclic-nucleotide 2'-phosphodiesterase/5'-nucleotidase/3'-nucleotidase [Deinococcus radiodurans]QIP33164
MKKSLFLLTALLGGAGLNTALAAPLTVTILHTDDLHGHLEPTKVGQNTYGGYSRQTTLVKQFTASDPNPLVLSGGDTFQGTLFFNLYQGLADVLFMNYQAYQAMAVGNHEFDNGPAALARFAQKANFPLLAANLDVSTEPLLKDLVKPYAVLSVGGEKIGVIGAVTPDLPTISSPGPNVKMLELMTSLKNSADQLRAQGINKIVLVSHLGYTVEQQVAATVPGIDVIVGGHSHTLLGTFDNKDFPPSEGPYPTVVQNPDGNKTLLVAAWEWGKVLGRLKVTFDDAGAVTAWEGNPIPVTSDIAEDDTARRMIGTLSVPIANLRQQVVGTTASALDGSREVVRRRESTMANVLADAALLAGQNAGAELALVNGGGVRASIDQGPVTFEEAITVQPFGNTLTVITLTGAQLKAALEYGVATWSENKGQFLHVSRGMSYTFDPTKPAGSRVSAVTLNGQPLDDARAYKVATNNFTASGGDGFTMFKDAPKLETGTLDVDVLVNYLKANPTLNAQPEGRIVIVNEPKK